MVAGGGIEPVVLARKEEGHSEVLEIVWIDSMLGGSGIFTEIVQHFPAVAEAAVRHLAGHDCPSSCYRCLRTYRNQRVHTLLNWRLVLPQLLAISGETVQYLPATPANRSLLNGPDWDEARREGCDSPQELLLLRSMREAGLTEAQKQFRITNDAGRLITQADFAYPDRRLLIYVDGLAFHSSIRMRVHDSMQTNQLQNMGYRVLRFVGPQVSRSVDSCVTQIQTALAHPN